jgi:hypothetical protein
MTEFTPMKETLIETLVSEGKPLADLINLYCREKCVALHFDVREQAKKIAYSFPPKSAEAALLFVPTNAATEEETAELKLELDKYGLSQGYTEPEPSFSSRCYRSDRYLDAREMLLERLEKTGKRFGVQWVATNSHSCLNRQETEILIHDESGEYVKVLFHKICDLYDYGVCVSNFDNCLCRIIKPISHSSITIEDMTEPNVLTTDDLFKFIA